MATSSAKKQVVPGATLLMYVLKSSVEPGTAGV